MGMTFLEVFEEMHRKDQGVTSGALAGVDGLTVEEWRAPGDDRDLSALCAEIVPGTGGQPRLGPEIPGVFAEDLPDDPPRCRLLSLGPVQVCQGHGPHGGRDGDFRRLRFRFRSGGNFRRRRFRFRGDRRLFLRDLRPGGNGDRGGGSFLGETDLVHIVIDMNKGRDRRLFRDRFLRRNVELPRDRAFPDLRADSGQLPPHLREGNAAQPATARGGDQRQVHVGHHPLLVHPDGGCDRSEDHTRIVEGKSHVEE